MIAEFITWPISSVSDRLKFKYLVNAQPWLIDHVTRIVSSKNYSFHVYCKNAGYVDLDLGFFMIQFTFEFSSMKFQSSLVHKSSTFYNGVHTVLKTFFSLPLLKKCLFNQILPVPTSILRTWYLSVLNLELNLAFFFPKIPPKETFTRKHLWDAGKINFCFSQAKSSYIRSNRSHICRHLKGNFLVNISSKMVSEFWGVRTMDPVFTDFRK